MFKFDLNEEVKISISGEAGKIVGRAEYVESSNLYLVQYVTAQGRAAEDWWKESVLEAA